MEHLSLWPWRQDDGLDYRSSIKLRQFNTARASLSITPTDPFTIFFVHSLHEAAEKTLNFRTIYASHAIL
jgi:hypothetical protein